MRKTTLLLLILPLALVVLVGATAFAGLQIAVHRVPESAFTREGIRKILARESVVYYADGKNKVGTFFEGSHRSYVPFDSIPRPLVDALVSAEDRNYWTHGGLDYWAFAKAMAGNLTSGGRWRGGSTLTQQTAKNLFGRTGPLRGKVDELINAYRLERHFSKQEILEFYLNQFYVVGNGHGVGIAARYFFDKDLKDLSLLECAFIAGSVKGPNQYNPFIQTTPERRQAALDRGRNRVAYVLKQMRQLGKISDADYRAALSQKLEFHRGAFRFDLSTNMVKVKRLLDTPEMQELLAGFGVEDYTGAGLQIYTTLDADVQRAAEYSVYSNLWRLDLLLRGYEPPHDSAAEVLSHFEPGEFHTGSVQETRYENGAPAEIRVRFGGLEGTVPRASLEAFFRQWNRNLTGADALPSPAAMTGFARRYLKPGSLVFCAVPYKTPDAIQAGQKSGADLELAQQPRLQGAAQVVREGKVLANVGGFGNTGYDRVNQARRQFGSAFKPLVYAAAIELGWTPLDPLPNARQAFQVGGLIYFPKPDHAPEDTVSLAWAGRRSENIASVYLLYHLFDKTDFDGFWAACRATGTARDNFSSDAEFEAFVRDSLGVVLDDDHLRELRFQKAVQDFSIDMTFDNRAGEAARLRTLPYGLGYARERAGYAAADKAGPDPENGVRARLLERNYLELAQRAQQWRSNAEVSWTAARSDRDGRLGVFLGAPGPEWRPVSLRDARTADEKSVFVEGEVSLETLRRLDERLRYAENNGDRYSRENLFASKDFRAQAALRYVVWFSRNRLGVTSKLDPVLSFPLGVNAITLGEAVNAYQVFQNGCRYATRFGQSQLYIEKIVSADGQTLFEDNAECQESVAPRTQDMLGAILASVVGGGTGQRIGRELRMPLGHGPLQVSVPAYGKTGTTNDYRNSAFLGFVAAPKGEGKGFDPASGYVVGVYTGFDDNAPMQRMGFRGTGAATSLPAWLATAQDLVLLKKFSERADTTDTAGLAAGDPPLFQRGQYRRYTVSRRTGLPQTAPEDPAYVEDVSDELDPGARKDDLPGSATLWIREE